MMSRAFIAGCLSILFATACGETLTPELSEQRRAIDRDDCDPSGGSSGCTNTNGSGVHVGLSAPGATPYRMGFATGRDNWQVTAFIQQADGTILARGWREGVAGPVDGRLTGAEWLGQFWYVKGLKADATKFIVNLDDGQGNAFALMDGELAGLDLLLEAPLPGGLGTQPFRLRFSAPQPLLYKGAPTQVQGFALAFRPEGTGPVSWTPYCRDGGANPHLGVFHQGSEWQPLDGFRGDSDDTLTLTCGSGAVATCMTWGYTPWERAWRSGWAAPTSLLDYHQACVHMKRAAYCGDRRAYTHDGVSIAIADPFEPSIQQRHVDEVEAQWGPHGALCLTAQREPNMPFLGCPQPLPTCPAALPPDGYLTSSAKP
jgi:hypothetical protein